MKDDLLKAIKEYKESHPEFDETMKKFQMGQEAYEKALASIGIKTQLVVPTYTLTIRGKYNVNVSRSTW